MSNNRFRIRYTFWLDILKGEEAEIAESIETLKDERKFAPTVRDGIRLINNLRKGKLDVLFELFPWVRAEFMDYMREIQLIPTNPSSDTIPVPAQSIEPQTLESQQAWLEAEQERLEAERKWHEQRMKDAEKALEAERERIETERSQTQNTLQQQLQRLEELLLQQGNKPISVELQPLGSSDGNPAQNNGIKQIGGLKPLAPPIDDDDDEDLLTVTKAKGNGNAAVNFLASMQALQQ